MSSSNKRKLDSSYPGDTPSKIAREFKDLDTKGAECNISRAHKTSINHEEKLNRCFEFSDDDFDDFVSSLPDSVMNGSQPLPGQVKFDFSQLPEHVLENIFSCLPIQDMMLSCSLVCNRWKDIIKPQKYMFWKKVYHLVRQNDINAYENVLGLMSSSGFNLEVKAGESKPPVTSYIGDTIRFVKKNCKLEMIDEGLLTKLHKTLKGHQLYSLAKDILEKRLFADNFVIKDDGDIWTVCSAIALLSPDTVQIKKLIDILCSFKPIPDVMDFLYMLASLLWILHKHQVITQEYHYRIFCSISSIENASLPLPLSDESSIDNLTHEQQRIVGHDFQPNHLVRVMAYAGAGKTTTLVACASSYPNKYFLYTSFSKAVVDLGNQAFYSHRNVACSTLHSLAYRSMNIRSHRYKLSRGSLRARDVREKLGMSDEQSSESVLIVKTLIIFMASDAMGLWMSHVPTKKKKKVEGKWVWVEVEFAERMMVLNWTKTFWKNTSNLENKRWPMTDDCKPFIFTNIRPTLKTLYLPTVYLKMWQLTKPKIRGYDVIMLDEAQDCTECMRDILQRQREHTALVFVGDSHQQIYGFRRARDALLHIIPSHTYYLTQSFRFGGEIAQVADCILRSFKFNGFLPPNEQENNQMKISDKTLLGVGSWGSVSGRVEGNQRVFLCRTNRGVIQKTLSFLSDEKMKERSVAIVGGAGKLGLDLILDIYHLTKGLGSRHKIKSRLIKRFDCLKRLIDEAELNEDQELLSKIEIVKTLGEKVPEAIEKLKGLPSNYGSADIVVSTVHKAKGLEFDTVILSSDFSEDLVTSIQKNKVIHPLLKEEANLLYVAATRAKRALELSPTLAQLLRLSNVRFLKPTPASQYFGDETNVLVTCAECKRPVSDKSLVIFRQDEIKHLQSGGPLCAPCANIATPGWGLILGDPDHIVPSNPQLMLHAHRIRFGPPV